MSLVTAGRAHIRPSRRTYLALGWYALEFAGPPVVIGIDSPISIHPIGSRMSGLFGTRFFYARRNSSSTTTPAADSARSLAVGDRLRNRHRDRDGCCRLARFRVLISQRVV